MTTRIAAFSLAVPLAVVMALLWLPGLDRPWMAGPFHFYSVSVACFMAAAICGVLVVSARSVRETRILFLALCFMSLALIFSLHGLTTPGHLYHQVSASLTRTPWMSTLAAGILATLSVLAIPRFMETTRLRLPELTFLGFSIALGAFVGVSMAFPDWLRDFPTTDAWFRYLLSAVTIGLLLFAAWRYFQSYLFTRLPAPLAVATGLGVLAEAQIALGLGEPWYLSWWAYHALFLFAFFCVLAGWGIEILRARDASAIADALAMRDALSQLNRGRSSVVVDLANQIEQHDLDTFRHVDRVAAFAYLIGHDMGFGAARLRRLVLAGQMHDIGKIGLPSYILTKAGKLTDDEWEQIKLHPNKGWEIINRVRGLRDIAGIIRHHHERF
ncbi:MAG TPA: HD domain-containing phosphohydrolase, partial [Dehalococcoidia bacterium]|nr:HD domain-containing phosphohydrolase [Dehalococcoidia bacterium]